MEILKILEESGEDLFLEDLDFFETELATGDNYAPSYQSLCRDKIKELRAWLTGDDSLNVPKANDISDDEIDLPGNIVVGIDKIAPKETNPIVASLSPEQLILREISLMRATGVYKTNFKKYVSEKGEIDSAFVDKHYSFFQPWELDAIVSVKQMPEEFLEKYFGALDHDKIARYQLFSEGFFMKHYSQMDSSVVLEHGKNEWRKKENRSKQLDVFLRLKGVKK